MRPRTLLLAPGVPFATYWISMTFRERALNAAQNRSDLCNRYIRRVKRELPSYAHEGLQSRIAQLSCVPPLLLGLIATFAMPSYYTRLDDLLRDKLHTWILTPTQQRSRLWELCSYRGVAFVRAESAVHARRLAAGAFCKDGALAPGRVVESPWLSGVLVRCEVDFSSRFNTVDTPGVVEPHTPEARN